MADIRVLIEAIKHKTERVVDKNQRLILENSELGEKISALQRSIELQRETIKDLEEKNKMLKIAQSIQTDNTERKALKQKINSVIREIDLSISLLND